MSSENQGRAAIPGMFLVRRTWQGLKVKGVRQRRYGWTLHLATCRHIARAVNKVPAPVVPYPDTIPCASCQPDGRPPPPRIKRGKKKVPARPGTTTGKPEHHYNYTQVDDGWMVRCVACGITATAANKVAARVRGYRRHRAAETDAAAGPGPQVPAAQVRPAGDAPGALPGRAA